MIYFTSDLHLGHEHALEFETRSRFSSVEQMNDVIINNINDIVGRDDELWILGDFSFRINKEQARELRNKIKCKKVHLVKGNHDKDYSGDHIFTSVQDYKELTKKDTGYNEKIILFHYPIAEWNTAHYGAVHLHGHIHTNGEYNANNLQKLYVDRLDHGRSLINENLHLRIYDVGVDANDFKPVSLDEIASLMGINPNDSKLK